MVHAVLFEPTNAKRARATILVSILWIIAIMTILVLGLSYEARSDMERTRLYRDRAKAYWIARAAVERVKYDYAVAKMRADQEYEEKARFTFQFDEGHAVCLLKSSSSYMSVNSTSRELWDQLLKFYEYEDQEREAIIDAIIDWTDPDDLPSLNGAESDYYQTLSPPYTPPNGPFFSVEELLLVRGISEEIFYGNHGRAKGKPGLKDLLRVSSNQINRFDLNTAPKGILIAFLEISEEEALEIMKAREEKLFQNVQEAGTRINIEALDNLNRFFMTYRGGQFTIRSTGFVHDSPARYTVEDEVRYTGSGKMFVHLAHKDFSLDHADKASVTVEEEK